jgi:hypothetical protein
MKYHPYRIMVSICVLSALGACSDTSSADCEVDATSPADAVGEDAAETSEGSTQTGSIPLRPRSNPTEYVALTVRLPVEDADVRTVLGPIFGLDGAYHTNFVIQDGVLLGSAADTRTSEQGVVTLTMETSTGDTPSLRTVASVPVGNEYGRIFVDAVEAAVAQAATRVDDDGSEPWRIEYRTRSANGGNLTIGFDSTGTEHQIVFSTQSPRTSLLAGAINQPALQGAPFESVYGLVYFTLSRDNFSFFVDRAYGISEGAAQNFNDFYLIPHNWLRLTVTPELDDARVDVAFEVVTTDNRRIPIARAPASLVAGEQFKQTVFRLIDTMLAAEEAQPGSSTPWEAPFYYDDPQGGGIVEVIAQGVEGSFRIAYAVESPVSELLDTAFVPWQGEVVVPPDWDQVDPGCAELGSEPAAQGFFDIRFEASGTIRESRNVDGELRGPVWGSIYRSQDVIITGPLPGTEAVASFAFEDVDVINGPSEQVFRIDTPLQAGDYQILGFMDIDDNADPADPGPERGDPVMIPIGGFTMQCAVQPITAEFAILLP